ncbi:NADH-quinone oxidoreductase subunit A [Desulfoglaeba alkanexedens]|jgi:NADH-quinone oxidoreductase subunit A|uniref:NADH-quinone oxidoreductase subunit A n=1 Tax=Desulfoglaeba alkanexedens ALDC TaxID=980445 RepID=A0A4P8KZF7_9BACT|nr:NADH-quinone oxidoreductase subunit A [Desulfoglaeba alkanexedens]QCQ20926.1 NADH-quinone oxidoreductase subunit A [Desulfoglaeba alkanexedens ALDC]
MTVYYVPALVYMGATIVLVSVILLLSSQLGRRRSTPEKMLPYECGVDPQGTMAVHYPIRFYVVAMIFIIFDIETVFLYPWAVVFRDLGWFGFVEMFLFAVILVIGLVYLYRKGALEWD